MCWSVRVSLAVAVYGYTASAYLWQRQRSVRDRWYGTFLATFVSTQLLDAFFWMLQEEGAADLPCSAGTLHALIALDKGAMNSLTTRLVLPPVLFLQLIVISFFPSSACLPYRWPYRVLTFALCLIPMSVGGCTSIWTGRSSLGVPTLLWFGFLPSLWLVVSAIGVGALGVILFLRPHAQ